MHSKDSFGLYFLARREGMDVRGVAHARRGPGEHVRRLRYRPKISARPSPT